MEHVNPILLIAGPTASGKSALALRLAARMGGALIVNADAMQVYRDLRVLTARPDEDDLQRAPHALFGHVDAGASYSVGAWTGEALTLAQEAQRTGRPVMIVGGTGLYFSALTDGLADIPSIDEEVRARVRDEIATALARGETLHALARRVDPQAAARIPAGDRQRLTRVIEVAHGTGRPLSAWRETTRPLLEPHAWRGIVLDPPRPLLYDRINARAEMMVRAGGVDEVRALTARGLCPDAPAMKALGVSHLANVLVGAVSMDEALALMQRDTRRYAKRQMTWFRNQMAQWSVLDPDQGAGAVDAAMAVWTHRGPGPAA